MLRIEMLQALCNRAICSIQASNSLSSTIVAVPQAGPSTADTNESFVVTSCFPTLVAPADAASINRYQPQRLLCGRSYRHVSAARFIHAKGSPVTC